MLADGNDVHPSLCTLTRPFRDWKKHDKLLERLASKYSDRPIYWPDASIVGVFSPKDQARRIEKNKKANAGRQSAFWRIIEGLRKDWSRLAKAAPVIGNYRNNLVAHLILQYDEKTGGYHLGQTPNPNKLYVTIEGVLPVITRSVATLAFLFGVGSGRIKDFESLAKKDAATFWDLKPATRRD